MDTLEHYLDSDYLAEKQEITAIDRMLGDVTATFSSVFDGKMWPYEFRTGRQPEAPNVSQGTIAMVLAATGRLLGNCALPTRAWIVQLHSGATDTTRDSITSVTADTWLPFDLRLGLEELRRIVGQLAPGTGVELNGRIGLTSHLADVIRRANVPARMR